MVQLSLSGPRTAVGDTIELVDGHSLTWEDLYSDLSPALESYARSRGVRDPEDLVQDVFASFYRRSDEFIGDMSGLRSLLFTIAYRRIVDAHRHSARRPEVLVAVPREAATGSTADHDVEESVVSTDTVSAALEALSALTERERSVITMRIFEEASPDEVSRRLGLTNVNVRVIQARAFRKVRAVLEAGGHFRHPLALVVSVPSLRHATSRLPTKGPLGDWVAQVRAGSGTASVPSKTPHLSLPDSSFAGQAAETWARVAMRAGVAVSALVLGAVVVIPGVSPTEPGVTGGGVEPPAATAAPASTDAVAPEPAEDTGRASQAIPGAGAEPTPLDPAPASPTPNPSGPVAIVESTTGNLDLLLAEIDGALLPALSELVEEVVDDLAGFAETTLAEVAATASRTVETATETTGAVVEEVVETAESVTEVVESTTGDVVETSEAVVEGAPIDPVVESVDEIVDNTGDDLPAPVEDITEDVDQAVDEVVGGTQDLVDDVRDLGLFD